MREKISACVICCNEELKIGRCLQSLTWCDEILVIDSFSKDSTVEICRKYTDRVYQREWLGYIGQRNMVREMASCPWILFLDSDEEVSPALRDEILEEFEKGTGPYLGYAFPRQVFYLGRWIRHGEWYPDIKLRLFKKIHGRTEGQEPHDKVVVNGPVKTLKNHIWHYTYDDIRDHLDTVNRFSTIAAQQKFVQENSYHWRDLVFRPFFHFMKGYFLKRGFLDGTHGLIIAMISSYGAFAKYAKLWELWLKEKERVPLLPEIDDKSAE